MILSPTIKVECDECSDDEEYSMTALAGGGWDDRNLARAMEKDGWITVGDRHFCGGCAEDTPPTPRAMTQGET